jgi:hypothetical protein
VDPARRECGRTRGISTQRASPDMAATSLFRSCVPALGWNGYTTPSPHSRAAGSSITSSGMRCFSQPPGGVIENT